MTSYLDDVPDFRAWETSRIEFLLKEYRTRLDERHPLTRCSRMEKQLYDKWTAAMQAELDRRNL